MGFLFNRPAPKQAVPGDLGGGRQQIINAIFGGGASGPTAGGLNRSFLGAGQLPGGQGPGQYLAANQGGGNVLQQLLGLTGAQGGTPGGDVLGPLYDLNQQHLNDQITQMNSSSPNRFSSTNLYEQGQLRQRSNTDFNALASQVLEHGRDRQLQAIMGLLGPVLGPTFGGPFTQDASLWENLLGGVQAAGSLMGGGAGAAAGAAGGGGGSAGFSGTMGGVNPMAGVDLSGLGGWGQRRY